MTYLSTMINMDPDCWTQVPLLLMCLAEILRGCGNPEWYQVPSQVDGNWQSFGCFCGVVNPMRKAIKKASKGRSMVSSFLL